MIKFNRNIIKGAVVTDRLNIQREKINEIDSKIAELFSQRMECAKNIAEIKSEYGLSVYDKKRETEVVQRELELLPTHLQAYYKKVLTAMMSVSKQYQNETLKSDTVLPVTTQLGSYNIYIRSSGLSQVGKLFDLDRKVLIVTDDGVPSEYSENVAAKCKTAVTVTLESGEKSKSKDTFFMLEKIMLENNFTRNDCVVAVGGGVVGDVSGYAASCYMRGIDFYNVPTTLLSQVDSSVGGKTAVNFGNIKNSVGAFKQPNAVLIDTSLLCTLDKKQISNGLAEVIKMSLTCDRGLFEIIENGVSEENLDLIIRRAVLIKRKIVELDENEQGLRRVLNFGHTVGHAIETQSGLLHGECVALGMLPMVSDKIRERLIPMYENLGLPTKFDIQKGFSLLVSHDKKSESEYINAVRVENIGEYEFVKMTADEIESKARQVLER